MTSEPQHTESEQVTLKHVQHASHTIKEVVHRTPLFSSETLNRETGLRSWFKAENQQKGGAFKVRGALNKLRNLPEKQKKKGVITFSSGNHGQAVALAASLEEVPCTVVMPEDARPVKEAAVKNYGAQVEKEGITSEERRQKAMELVEKHGYTVVPPYDDPHIVAGQGTVGLEILDQLPHVHYVFVPVGGGGLVSGVSLAVKKLNAKVKVIGVETEGADDATRSFQENRLVKYDRTDTIADGMRNLCVGDLNFAMMMEYVDDMLTVSDEEVTAMMRFFFERMKLVVEPTGAVAVAAMHRYADRYRAKNTCAVISGGNIGIQEFAGLASGATEAGHS